MQPYDPNQFETKWQEKWRTDGLFQGTANKAAKDKFYALFAFAYPSGSGLHVGHVESKTALDILVRYLRMSGKDVFFPVGWDAFGLPAENYAIKTGVHPSKTTVDAIHAFERQVQRLGISYDWESEIATCRPEYYKWTQWIFVQLFKAGLAYRDKGWVNWCPSCKTVLANEQVVDGKCERCGTPVVQKELEQWKFKITAYQDELLSGLDKVDWPKSTKDQQKNWIGKSEGAQVKFAIKEGGEELTCFTTRLDTIYGVTFVVISPEKFKELGLARLVGSDKTAAVNEYLDKAFHKTEEQRRIGEKDKTGVDTGIKLIHPITHQEIPLWIADYVLAGYGTGVVMGVPAHDERDGAFARKMNLPVVEVISEAGKLINSGEYNDLDSAAAIAKLLVDHPESFTPKTSYKLRDWLISRQRYWGAPIPMTYCEHCGWQAVSEAQLPVLLPEVPDFRPTDDGKSPLEKAPEEWKYTTCSKCGGRAKREVDTMDTFVDSSWYYLRYTDARNNEQFARKEQMEKWLPVDMYLIGPEHTVLHLLYSRFFTKFLRDQGYLSFDEPFLKMRHQGMILGPDGKKMSKSKGNVINPDEIIEKFGADTLRVYEMFMGPLDADKAWDMSSVAGVYRFLTRVDRLFQENKGESSVELTRKLHQTIKKVGEDIPSLKFNTAIAALMELVNVWSEAQNQGKGLASEEVAWMTQLLAPFAPFLAEELWSRQGKSESIHLSAWPTFDSKLVQDETIELVIQVNSKVKGRITVSAAESKDRAVLETKAKEFAATQGLSADAKIIVVPGKLINIVAR